MNLLLFAVWDSHCIVRLLLLFFCNFLFVFPLCCSVLFGEVATRHCNEYQNNESNDRTLFWCDEHWIVEMLERQHILQSHSCFFTLTTIQLKNQTIAIYSFQLRLINKLCIRFNRNYLHRKIGMCCSENDSTANGIFCSSPMYFLILWFVVDKRLMTEHPSSWHWHKINCSSGRKNPHNMKNLWCW